MADGTDTDNDNENLMSASVFGHEFLKLFTKMTIFKKLFGKMLERCLIKFLYQNMILFLPFYSQMFIRIIKNNSWIYHLKYVKKNFHTFSLEVAKFVYDPFTANIFRSETPPNLQFSLFYQSYAIFYSFTKLIEITYNREEIPLRIFSS